MRYVELARAIGSPTAARAVARACARNPIALLIPCHRIVPARGGAGGYRWGAQRKEQLLEIERVS
jgi:AraC family transcriptional regulator of adaptative response/methylated-DNA-[protein]-cysteine methyltransferase